MRRTLALIASLLIVSAAPAGAATLSLAEGNVLVNTGNGFVRGVLGQQLKPGDRVMIGTGGGNATIAYDLTCLARVNRTTGLVTVARGVPCTASSPLAPAEAGTGLAGGNGALIVGGAAAAVGIGLGIYALTKPSSP